MSWEKGERIYDGKGKRVYALKGHNDVLLQEFKNQLTAFNAVKVSELDGKGELNCLITTAIFKFLGEKHIPTHFVEQTSTTSWVTKKLDMIPLEVVVRNILAGSTAKKFAIEEGTPLEKPLVEFYYKKDELNDPFISDEQALMMKAAQSQKDLDTLKSYALAVNKALIEFFHKCGIKLVDFKLEFGVSMDGQIMLGDEISPDSCRLWDEITNEKLDKDRFRRDLGQVKEKYQEVWTRIQKEWSSYV
jgi:phosphoribosylaminoimidazole-succinocarboxamide synthase